MTINTQGPPQTQINSIIALYSDGQIQEALDSVETLTKDYPNESLLYNINGVCYRAISKLDEAVKSFEKALALKPDYTEVHNNLGIVLMGLEPATTGITIQALPTVKTHVSISTYRRHLNVAKNEHLVGMVLLFFLLPLQIFFV